MRSAIAGLALIGALAATVGCGGDDAPSGPTKLTAEEARYVERSTIEIRREVRESGDKQPNESDQRRDEARCRQAARRGPVLERLEEPCLRGVRASAALFTGLAGLDCEDDDGRCGFRALRRATIEAERLDRVSGDYARLTRNLEVSEDCRTLLAGSKDIRVAVRRLATTTDEMLTTLRKGRDSDAESSELRKLEGQYDAAADRLGVDLEAYGQRAMADLRTSARSCRTDVR